MSRPYIVTLLFKLYAEYILLNAGKDGCQEEGMKRMKWLCGITHSMDMSFE